VRESLTSFQILRRFSQHGLLLQLDARSNCENNCHSRCIESPA
jgi:hypothetical protein